MAEQRLLISVVDNEDEEALVVCSLLGFLMKRVNMLYSIYTQLSINSINNIMPYMTKIILKSSRVNYSDLVVALVTSIVC
jgi:hypothetical protein